MSEEQWEGMFRAQCTWDATMAHNAIRGLRERVTTKEQSNRRMAGNRWSDVVRDMIATLRAMEM